MQSETPTFAEPYSPLSGEHGGDALQRAMPLSCMRGSRVLLCLLQHCPGQVDEYLEQFVMLAVRRLQMPSCESKNLKCLLVTVVANGLFYNASLCLQVRLRPRRATA
jgi:hypothetical protein